MTATATATATAEAFTATATDFTYEWSGDFDTRGDMTRFGYRMTATLGTDAVWTVTGVVLRADGTVVNGFTQTGRTDNPHLVNPDGHGTDARQLCNQVAYNVVAPISNIDASIYHHQWNALLGHVRSWASETN